MEKVGYGILHDDWRTKTTTPVTGMMRMHEMTQD